MTDLKQKKATTFAPVPPPAVNEKDAAAVPEYLTSVYGRRYFHPWLAAVFDSKKIAAPATCFLGGKLTKSVTNEIIEGDDVLQLGVASGDFEREVASKMNGKGTYCIEDVSPAHIDAMKPRVSPWLNVVIKERDFTVPDNKRYDVVIGWFSLHELPDTRKKAALKRAFNALKPTGKMIFVDYAAPKRFHPLKPVLKTFNRLFEPFAESLWYNEIESFAPKTDKLIWAKKTCFGDLYQCVIAQRR